MNNLKPSLNSAEQSEDWEDIDSIPSEIHNYQTLKPRERIPTSVVTVCNSIDQLIETQAVITEDTFCSDTEKVKVGSEERYFQKTLSSFSLWQSRCMSNT